VYEAIPDHIGALYATLGEVGYHPRGWREATTVVIPKPNKPDYSSVKAYRPIALLNCLGKILEKLMATRLSQMAESHDLLHDDQIGGRPKHSAIDATMALMHDIEANAGRKFVMSSLFLDVRGAFDNVSSTRLLHTMRNLGCPKPVLSWGTTFLTERTTALSFDGHTDAQCPITMGIPQGSPASPILFLIYLRPLFDALNNAHPTIWMPSYIDDVALVTHGRTREENARALEAAARTAFTWAQDNAVAFDDSKSELLHFHRARDDTHTTATNVQLPNGTIVTPGTKGGRRDIVRWIGVYFDRKLSFTHHVQLKLTAASRSLNALCSLVRHETGLSPSATRSLYRACIVSRSDFGAEIWWTGQKGLARKLQTQQNSALRRILNAFRSTPTLALHNEAALPPVSVRLHSKQRKYILRLLSLPPSHPVVKCCPSSFPIPNHFYTSLYNPNEYDCQWQTARRPPSRLVGMLSKVSRWVLPDDVIEDTAHPVTTPWTPNPVTTDIPTLPKDEAAIEHLSLLRRLRRRDTNIIAYTDGSQLASNTGAGYYISDGLPREVHAIIPMGNTSEVFDAELRAIHECILACHKYITLNRLCHRSLHLFTDNQSAILRASCLTGGPGQELARAIHDTALLLQAIDVPITLHWVPGHTDIIRNDEADRLAKAATSLPPPTPLPISLSWL
jgi:ribonuclease HI